MLSVCFRMYLTVYLALHPANQTISWLRSVDNSWIMAITNKLTLKEKIMVYRTETKTINMFYMWVLFVRIDVLFVLLRCFNITVWVHDMLNELLKSSTSNYQRDWKKRKKRNHLLNFTVRLINVLSLHNINLMHHFISRRWWRHLIEIQLLSLKTNFYLAMNQ